MRLDQAPCRGRFLACDLAALLRVVVVRAQDASLAEYSPEQSIETVAILRRVRIGWRTAYPHPPTVASGDSGSPRHRVAFRRGQLKRWGRADMFARSDSTSNR